jgi:hypothetical protein
VKPRFGRSLTLPTSPIVLVLVLVLVIDSPAVRYCAPSRLPELEKEAFGSVTFCLVVFPFPLWHEAIDPMSAARMNRAIHFNCCRMPNESRTNAGCKPTKEYLNDNQKVARRSIFGVV